jgi:hypothetical protein
MIIIPGFLIAWVTFPGVIVHEAAHMLFCRLRRVAVFDVCYLRMGNPSGYVISEPSKDFTSAFLVSVGPFLVNSVLCVLICFPVFLPVRVYDQGDLLSYFLLWLGISIGMHAFPSNQDAHVLWTEARRSVKEGNLWAIVSMPLVAVIFVANLLSFFWLDLFYGIGIGLVLPEVLVRQLS